MTTTSPTPTPSLSPTRALTTIAKRSYAVLATTSEARRSHSAGVLYALSGRELFVSTLRSSRKARNVATNPHVGVTIPVRRVPVGGPPSAIMFQSTATVLETSDPDLRDKVAAGELGTVTAHGELDLPDGVFLRIPLPSRLLTYGLGMSLLSLIRDPLNAGGVVDLDAPTPQATR